MNTLKTMNIARRNTGKNRVCIIQSRTNNRTGDGLRSFAIKIRANVVENTDMKVGWRADVRNTFVEIEMTFKSNNSNTKELDVL